jgi:hypothetical protein
MERVQSVGTLTRFQVDVGGRGPLDLGLTTWSPRATYCRKKGEVVVSCNKD